MDLDLAVVRDEEPIAVLCTLDDAFHLTSIELPFRVGVTAQAPQDHLSKLMSGARRLGSGVLGDCGRD